MKEQMILCRFFEDMERQSSPFMSLPGLCLWVRMRSVLEGSATARTFHPLILLWSHSRGVCVKQAKDAMDSMKSAFEGGVRMVSSSSPVII